MWTAALQDLFNRNTLADAKGMLELVSEVIACCEKKSARVMPSSTSSTATDDGQNLNSKWQASLLSQMRWLTTEIYTHSCNQIKAEIDLNLLCCTVYWTKTEMVLLSIPEIGLIVVLF